MSGQEQCQGASSQVVPHTRRLRRLASGGDAPVEVAQVTCIRGLSLRKWKVLGVRSVDGREAVAVGPYVPWLHQVLGGRLESGFAGATAKFAWECKRELEQPAWQRPGVEPSGAPDGLEPSGEGQAVGVLPRDGEQQIVAARKGRAAVFDDGTDSHERGGPLRGRGVEPRERSNGRPSACMVWNSWFTEPAAGSFGWRWNISRLSWSTCRIARARPKWWWRRTKGQSVGL